MKLRIVLDTNVLISGIFFTGSPYEILKAWKEKHIQFVITAEIFDEYVRVAEILSNKYATVNISKVLDLIAIHSEIIQPVVLPTQICEDKDDDKFIACALSGEVDVIVSGDKHLLRLNGFKGIEIIKPKSFCVKYLS
ncbi:putative toxin-antitoxin system toxin component, PIN family [candidate division KSB1 bacterium]|nr:putative toxin-antitoxin system toxin component, PIN family [candidate division KSB1 bacterium]